MLRFHVRAPTFARLIASSSSAGAPRVGLLQEASAAFHQAIGRSRQRGAREEAQPADRRLGARQPLQLSPRPRPGVIAGDARLHTPSTSCLDCAVNSCDKLNSAAIKVSGLYPAASSFLSLRQPLTPPRHPHPPRPHLPTTGVTEGAANPPNTCQCLNPVLKKQTP